MIIIIIDEVLDDQVLVDFLYSSLFLYVFIILIKKESRANYFQFIVGITHYLVVKRYPHFIYFFNISTEKIFAVNCPLKDIFTIYLILLCFIIKQGTCIIQSLLFKLGLMNHSILYVQITHTSASPSVIAKSKYIFNISFSILVKYIFYMVPVYSIVIILNLFFFYIAFLFIFLSFLIFFIFLFIY